MKLTILSYNIHRAIGVDRRFRLERIVRVLEHHAADIVLLQEVDEGAPRSGEIDLARHLAAAAGYPHFAVGHNVSLRRGRYGNATLSRYPIVRERNIDLTIGRRKRRGCQRTRIQIGPVAQRSLEVFNLHLGLSAGERHRQVRLLSHAPEFTACGASQPCVVGGDFNDWRSLLHGVFVDALGFRCATQVGDSGGRSLRTYPSFSPSGSLDRIYYRGPLHLVDARTSRLAVVRVASDHLPVVAELELR